MVGGDQRREPGNLWRGGVARLQVLLSIAHRLERYADDAAERGEAQRASELRMMALVLRARCKRAGRVRVT
jgi:hypothetical protein